MKVLKHLSENYNFRSEEIKETKERCKITMKSQDTKHLFKIEYYFLDFHFLSNRQREDLKIENTAGKE